MSDLNREFICNSFKGNRGHIDKRLIEGSIKMKKFPSHMNFFEASKINLGFLLCYFQKIEL